MALAGEAVDPGSRLSCFGHLGDGNIHFSVSQPTSADKSAFLARWDAINDVVHAIAAWMGGSFSAEHGGEQLKLAADERPGALAVMRAVKAALDWNGVKNLGKLLSLVEGPAGAMDGPPL